MMMTIFVYMFHEEDDPKLMVETELNLLVGTVILSLD